MPSLQVRNLPEHIYQRIAELAKVERRSIAQETVILLEKALNLDNQAKERRRQLISLVVMESEADQSYNIPDPVSLIREDRER